MPTIKYETSGLDPITCTSITGDDKNVKIFLSDWCTVTLKKEEARDLAFNILRELKILSIEEFSRIREYLSSQ